MEPVTSSASSASLRRDLGLLDAVGIGLGAIMGAGLFVVTGVAAGVAGPALLLGLLLAAVAAACNALSSAQLAAAYPQSGGTYEYGYRVLNPTLGFAAGWMFLASKLAAAGTVALGFAGYLAELIPTAPHRPVAVGAAAFLVAANLIGIKKAGKLNLGIVAVTVLALLYFLAGGIGAVRAAHFTPFAPYGGEGVLQAAALLFFAYTGYARIATLGEEVREPETTIPRAILLSLALAAFLYAAVVTVAVGAVGAQALAQSGSPIARAAAVSQLPGTALVVGVGATTAMLGVLLSQILGISRMMLAMARRDDLPRALAHIREPQGVPDRAVLVCGLVIALVAVFGTIRWVVSAATFTILVYYAITNLAALRLDRAQKRFPDAVAWVGLAGCVLLALSLSPRVLGFGIVLLALGFALRALWKRALRA